MKTFRTLIAISLLANPFFLCKATDNNTSIFDKLRPYLISAGLGIAVYKTISCAWKYRQNRIQEEDRIVLTAIQEHCDLVKKAEILRLQIEESSEPRTNAREVEREHLLSRARKVLVNVENMWEHSFLHFYGYSWPTYDSTQYEENLNTIKKVISFHHFTNRGSKRWEALQYLINPQAEIPNLSNSSINENANPS